MNGFYTGEPVDFDFFPPPRPSPDAVLDLVKPRDSDASLDVDVSTSFGPSTGPNRVTVRFSASTRLNRVTGLGEMKWEHGRAYYGLWRVSWDA